ncbi:hypothetical protein ACFFMN_11690 [Planobispora siamensis]|uniref:Uncharacterized protein n=1 Tax=Planobispora siamensis TaxID=936338 RepID=A0A8J3WHW6_9ACTN|nr:hypothetical protein [Planobispora siamensis]GIH89988.1 hypothetical protein Psi01_06180 [Planobispora siamensis]
MNPRDAQLALDNIRSYQDVTREEIVRRLFPLPHVLLSALGLFATFASTDLENPWRTVALVIGLGLYTGVWIMCTYSNSVQRKPSRRELGVYLALSASLLVVFSITRIAAFSLFGIPAHGLLSQGVVAGAVAALTYVALTPLARRAMRRIIHQGDGRD